jgi:hypothetical protein
MKSFLLLILLVASGSALATQVCGPDGTCVEVSHGTVTGPTVPPPPPTPPSQPVPSTGTVTGK